MPQGAIPISEQKVDGANSKLSISSTTGVTIKTSGGRLDDFVITNAGTTTNSTVSFYDASSTASTAATNLIGTWVASAVANNGLQVSIEFPFLTGLTAICSSTTVSVSVSFN